MKIANPFLTVGYISPEYFCDRSNETEKIMSAIENGRDLTLISLRRMGKTGLIQHVIHQSRIMSEYNVIYCDIYQANNLVEMTRIFGNTTFNQLEKTTDRMLKKLKQFFLGIASSVTINPITLQTDIDFRIENSEQAEITIQQIFSMIDKSVKPVVLVFDEFQQIEKFPEKNVEAILRTFIQQMNNVRLIYSGSSKHILSAMFSDRDRPFYQSTQLLQLGKISSSEYIKFIRGNFMLRNIQISDEAANNILEFTRNHTYYVQYLCNRLFETGISIITREVIIEKLTTILQENESYYFGYRNLLTEQQYSLLKAIAKEDRIAQPSSRDFINKHKLGTTSTINSAIKSLLNKELIFREEGSYKVYDVFFSLWLKLFN